MTEGYVRQAVTHISSPVAVAAQTPNHARWRTSLTGLD
ncbi:hypothetical protein Pd630_LPD00837 [Rhodococcus opacus PD630]|nr:hypothetical protein Pd630_LPD00837 [Rhodococcus opacus PD630]